MKSLRAKLLAALALALLVVCLPAFGWYAWTRSQEVNGGALRLAEAVADALGAAVGPHLEGMDERGVQRAVEAAIGAYTGAAVLGRSGRVLAAAPALPPGVDPAQFPTCAGCHGGQAPRPSARLGTGEDGGAVARVVRPLASRESCRGCHPGDGDPLGYVYLEVPVEGELARLWRELVAVLGIGVGAGIALLGLGGAAVGGFVLRPLGRLRELAEQWSRGEPRVEFDVGGADEAAALGAALKGVALRQAEVVGDLAGLTRDLRERSGEAQGAFARLRQGSKADRDAAQGILGAVGSLDADLERIRGNLNAIASATSDNSTSLTQMSASIDEVAASADQLSQQVEESSSSVFQMVRSIGEVAERIDVLARETEATASSMAQIDASTRQIEANARETAELSGRMAGAAREGSLAVEETLRGIHESYGVIRETARAMGELAEASKAIGGVVKIINDVNDKTKLLALNAAIIAAQTGEHGRAFAVVAHEIKSLSDRTAAGTGEISRIIRGVRDRTEAATQAVSQGEDTTARSVQLAERAGRTLEKILSTAQVAHGMNREILRATEEQSRGSQSVMASMQTVSALVEYIRQAAQEHRRSGESVTAAAGTMGDLTTQVKLATAEQAEVSRYLSEAISGTDRNLRELLEAVEAERAQADRIFGHMTELEERNAAQEQGLDRVEELLQDLLARVERVGTRASRLGRGEEGRG